MLKFSRIATSRSYHLNAKLFCSWCAYLCVVVTRIAVFNLFREHATYTVTNSKLNKFVIFLSPLFGKFSVLCFDVFLAIAVVQS